MLHIRFTVFLPGRGMKWRCPLPEPVSTASRPYLNVRYRAEDLSTFGDYFVWIADESGGRLRREERIIGMPSIEDDGSWHRFSVKVPAMQLTTLAIQVQAASTASYIEVSEISLTPERPAWRLRDVLDFDIRAEWDPRFRSISLRPNDAGSEWLKRLHIEGGWFPEKIIALESIPSGS